MNNPAGRRLARRWHWWDVGIHALIFTFALVGLIGHYRLAAREDALWKP